MPVLLVHTPMWGGGLETDVDAASFEPVALAELLARGTDEDDAQVDGR